MASVNRLPLFHKNLLDYVSSAKDRHRCLCCAKPLRGIFRMYCNWENQNHRNRRARIRRTNIRRTKMRIAASERLL